jgi:hypothetical protein
MGRLVAVCLKTFPGAGKAASGTRQKHPRSVVHRLIPLKRQGRFV